MKTLTDEQVLKRYQSLWEGQHKHDAKWGMRRSYPKKWELSAIVTEIIRRGLGPQARALPIRRA